MQDNAWCVILPFGGYDLNAAPNTDALARYVEQILGVPIAPEPALIANLPFFLGDLYEFARFTLLGHGCLALLERAPAGTSPANVRKHLDLVARETSDLCIYVPSACSSDMRARLIQQRVPFIVPGNQLYLPDLGMDLREHFRKLRQQPDALGPASQVVLLHALLQPAMTRTTPHELARRLGYTPMTMTRVADELAQFGLVQATREGRNRWLDFGTDKKSLWLRALPLLRSPVAQTVWVALPSGGTGLPELRLTGQSALTESTTIAAPAKACWATAGEGWRAMQHSGVRALPYEELANASLQVWRYDPTILATGGMVDPLSLYLSLRDDEDERVAMALDELLETLKWS